MHFNFTMLAALLLLALACVAVRGDLIEGFRPPAVVCWTEMSN